MSGYTLEEQFARGGFGEIWRGAHTIQSPAGQAGHARSSQTERFVLKRIALKKGMEVSQTLRIYSLQFRE